MPRKTKTWILVADAGRARAFERLEHDAPLAGVESFDLEHPMEKTSEAARDALPRTYDSVGPGRHAITPKTDPHRADKAAFARTLADRLDAAAQQGLFDDLVLVAPPQMMGDLRAALPDAVKSRVRHELTQDLTHASPQEIAQHLKTARVA